MSAAVPDRSSILIVDDMEENLVALEAVLGPLDQQLVTARSGEDALKAMLRQDFAVVLLDVLMPGMDGFETAGNIKRLDQTKDVPIILLTGTDVDADYAYRGYSLGAADFLSKPIDPWVLRTKVNVFLDLDRKNRQLAVQAEQLRRLLVAEHAPRAGGRSAAAAEGPPEGTRPDSGRPEETGAGRSAAEQLAHITEMLVQIEMLLRDGENAASSEFADRIAELEKSVRRLGSVNGNAA
ncbi:two-component system response regulator [Streptomyces sp. WMMB 322]|uniref:response regulator n=1 Tax=Streptomyces sp. WMMB 322 TaxID=1286821 RepID=UPI0006E35A47|nr:response regulator [Streptomyces sp. WMMB 322]SCK45595.1 Response regulator receiver domain-containing protein [Streptomyces sp. WMMB 322]